MKEDIYQIQYSHYSVIYINRFDKKTVRKALKSKEKQHRKITLRLSQKAIREAYGVMYEANKRLKMAMKYANTYGGLQSFLVMRKYYSVKPSLNRKPNNGIIFFDTFRRKNGYPYLEKVKETITDGHYLGFIDDLLNEWSVGKTIEF